MTTEAFDVDTIAAAYRKATEFRAGLKDQMDAVDSDLKALKDMLYNHMLNNNLDSLKTTAGDKMHLRSTKRYSSGDWPHFKAWVLQNPDAIELFENRLHQGNVGIWLKENEGNQALVPPGLSAHTTTTIVVTPAKTVKE